MTPDTAPTPDDAVRRYLQYLEDPASLRDNEEIQKLTSAVLEARDPLDKLKAIAALERAANIDGEPIRKAFVAVARQWAEDNDIPLRAWREMKVTDDTLREAGFRLTVPQRRGGRATPSARARSMPVDDIKQHMVGRVGPFTLGAVGEKFGGSPATLRKAANELVNDGKLKQLGPDPNHQGVGRAPDLFEVVQ
jgi:hypothetical protein